MTVEVPGKPGTYKMSKAASMLTDAADTARYGFFNSAVTFGGQRQDRQCGPGSPNPAALEPP